MFYISTYSATNPFQKKDLLFLTQISFFGFLGVGLLILGTLILLRTLDYQNESHDKPNKEMGIHNSIPFLLWVSRIFSSHLLTENEEK